MMTIDTFNTYRDYSSKGQQIVWVSYKDVTLFVDLVRDISGVIPEPCTTRSEVMKAYDDGNYLHSLHFKLKDWLVNFDSELINKETDRAEKYLNQKG